MAEHALHSLAGRTIKVTLDGTGVNFTGKVGGRGEIAFGTLDLYRAHEGGRITRADNGKEVGSWVVAPVWPCGQRECAGSRAPRRCALLPGAAARVPR